MIMNYDNPNDMWHVWKNTFNILFLKNMPLCGLSVLGGLNHLILPPH